MFRLHRTQQTIAHTLPPSRLLDQNTFYSTFLSDLRSAKSEVIIECPFITARRMDILLPSFRALRRRSVRLIINTKPLDEHEPQYRFQAEQAIAELQQIGALVLFTDGHHRKLAIIDGQILYEGSLNILSQNYSCEIMRRTHSEHQAQQMLTFINLQKFLG